MKKLLLLCACLIVLLSCNNQNNAKVPELTFEDAVVGILQLYQNVDSQLVAERNELYQLLLKHSEPAEEASEEDKGYFLRNIVHIDSVVNQGAALIKENKISELLALLEAELPNFYAHPHNFIDNEIMLHQLLAELYRQTAESYMEGLPGSQQQRACSSSRKLRKSCIGAHQEVLRWRGTCVWRTL